MKIPPLLCDSLRSSQYGRIFTSAIVHTNPLHLYFNVLSFGSLTECEEVSGFVRPSPRLSVPLPSARSPPD